MGSSSSSSSSDDSSGSLQKKKLKTGLNSNDGPISKLHARLNKFRDQNRYWDVTIHIQQAVFNCHRLVLVAVSEYFDMMFNGNFNESIKKEIELVNNVDAQAFAEILNFSYTGIIPTLTKDNVFNILKSSEYLRISDIEDKCIEYIERNLSSIENVIEILRFAVDTNKKCLKENLIRHICQYSHIFSADAKLLELGYEELSTLLIEFRLPLSDCSYLRFRDENVLLDVLIRWVHHSWEERSSYFGNLSRLIDFERISAEYKTFLSNNYKIECTDELSLQKAISDNLCSGVDIDMPCVPLNNYLVSSENNLSLYAFVSYWKDKVKYESMRVFSVNEQKPSWWSFAGNLDSYPIGKLKTIVLEKVPDYFFAYNSDGDHSEFCTYSSVDFSSRLQRLNRPPCHSDTFEMCGKNNIIYWYNSDIHVPLHYHFGERIKTFNEEEIHRGIYGYQLEQNKWFPLPEMKVKLANSCMTVDDNLIYLIGGIDSNEEVPAGYVQGYDCRTPTWLELPKTCKSYENAVSCMLNGKIYVSDGKVVEMYNPVAGKWEMVSSRPQDASYTSKVMQMIPYKNLLWIFYQFRQISIIDPYEPSPNKWCISTLLNDKIMEHYGHCDSDDEDAYDWHRGKFGKNAPKDLDTTAKIRNLIVFQKH